ncbi:unnamed protein product [Spirodela intermedia]|uniref:Uncharacterized protein n=1 Tax=Spirodela intermedia TaxID=51605 RepID=A0A7I8JYF9_SPIIN|nr:unnamed protein product [Spirodela intermedia]
MVNTEVSDAVDYLRQRFSISGNDLKQVEDVKSLNEMFQMIRASLNDAEEMEITSEAARLCLRKLKKSFYDAEDVLDEFLHHVLRLKSEAATFPADGNVERDPTSSTSPHGNLVFMDDLVQTIRDSKVRLDKEKIDWDAHAKRLNPSYQLVEKVRPPSTSLMGSSRIIGRGDALENIKGLLFSEFHGDGNIPVIAIVGMGGLGKTTLAQCVYNDPQVQERFDKKIWVRVSEDFDVLRLTRAILESLEQEKSHLTEMDKLRGILRSTVKGKRLLLVLDDIWEHRDLKADVWEDLCRPLLRVSIGSKIIVTTRSKKLLDRVLIPASIYRLPYLTNNDCFMLFIRHAFQGWTSDIDPTLLDIAKKISNRCRGLPLAAKILGSLLRGQDDKKEWTNILNNTGIWDSDDQNPIMPILRLSYQYLPTTLKKCFRYCSVFPKDYEFYKHQLINMWMAHGYLTQAGQRKGQLEDIGEEYINELVSMSFFEQSQNHETFQMHDLIHDLARDVSQGEWWSVEDGVFYGSHDDSVQHCSVISTKYYSQKDVQSSAQSRSLLFFKSSLKYPYTKELWSEVKQLRVLHMSYTGISIRPNCFSSLKHLRYLNLQGNQISKLPESLGSLYLLETLNLNRTNIGVLPDWICLLKHLRYLGLRGTYINYLPESLGMLDQLHTLDIESVRIDYLPDSISNLSSLRRLICKDDVVFPSEIRKLTDIQMMDHFDDDRHLTVKEITDLINVDEAKKVSSHSKEHLKVLSLVWNDNRSLMAHHMHGKVLESLGRHPNLRQLYMYGFGGNSLSSWLKDPSYLPCLNRIDLIRCEQLTSLPPLENFPRLRHVHIESAKRLQDMGVSNRNQWHGFHAVRVLKIIRCPELQLSRLGDLRNLQHLSIIGSNQDIPINFSSGGFGQLETLELKHLPNWRSWAGPQEDECSSLQKLSVVGCNSLENFSITWLSNLQDIYVENCLTLKIFKKDSMILPDMEKYSVSNIWQIKVVSHMYDMVDDMKNRERLYYSPAILLWSLSTIEHLVISECTNLASISSEELPSKLKFIQVDGCKNMRYLQLGNQHALEYLSIKNCHRLSHVKCISSILRFLLIQSSQKSVFCHVGNLTKVEYLSIRKCVLELLDVQQLPSASKVMKIDQSILDVLVIIDYPDWTSLPPSLLESIKELRIIRCSGSTAPEDVKWLSSTLKKLEVIECPDLTYFPLDLLENIEELTVIRCSTHAGFIDVKRVLPTLKKLDIVECSNLTYFSFCSLESLEELRITRCSFRDAFIEVTRLPSKLKRFDIVECSDLAYFQLDLLESLEELKICRCSLHAEFLNVKRVSSTLKILEIVECYNFGYLQLQFFESLKELKIIKCSDLAGLIDVRTKLSTLRKIEIVEFYNLGHFQLHLFESLEELRLIRCSFCATFLDVKRVPSTLKKLEIDKCFDLTYFPVCLLESLEELKIIRCSGLDAFKDVKRVSSTLKKLEIDECFDMNFFSLHLLESLKELKIIRCFAPDEFIDGITMPSILENLEIVECNNLGFLKLELVGSLKELRIIRCHNFLGFKGMKRVPPTLQKLEIVECYNLTFFPLCLLESLEELKIFKCPTLAGLRHMETELSTLKKLEIVEFNDLTSFPHNSLENSKKIKIIGAFEPAVLEDVRRLSSTLKRLVVVKCSNLTSLSLDLLKNLEAFRIIRCSDFVGFIDIKRVPSTLKKLEIIECYNLNYFELHLLEGLEELRIIRCSEPAASIDVRRLPSTLKKLDIVECSNLSYFRLDLLESLEELRITRCSGPAIFIHVKWLPPTLRTLQIDTFWGFSFRIPCESDVSKKLRNRYDVKLYLPLERFKVLQQLILQHSPQLCISEDKNLPSTLQELSIIGCPKLEEWCKRHRQRLVNIRMLEIGEVRFRAPTEDEDEDEDDDVD